MVDIPPWLQGLDVDPSAPLSNEDLVKVFTKYCDHQIKENNRLERELTNDKLKLVIDELGSVKTCTDAHETMITELALKINTFNMYFEQLIHNLQVGLHDAFFRVGSHMQQVFSKLLSFDRGNESDISSTKSLSGTNRNFGNNKPETEQPLVIHLETDHANLAKHTVANVPQIDGNETINDSDEDEEADVLDRNPALCTASFTFNDPVATRHESLPKTVTNRARTATFTLNKNKQVQSLGTDTKLDDFEITINDEDKNVGIQCSTAFYEAVAKPVLCGLEKQTSMNIDNIPVNCHHIDYNRDSKGVEYNRVLHFHLGGAGKHSMGKITMHLHHTKRSIQMQGGATMPDQNKAPVWFLNVFVKDRFKQLAAIKHYDIVAFNKKIEELVKSCGPGALRNACSKCKKQFSQKSVPTLCSSCRNYFHKSTCLPLHAPSCPTDRPSSSPSTAASSSEAPNPSKRIRSESSVPGSSLSSTRTILSSASAEASRNIIPAGMITTVPISTTQTDQQLLVPQPQSNQRLLNAPTYSNPSFGTSSLNASAQPFSFSATTTDTNNSSGNNSSRKHKQSKPPNISPESAKVQYLNLELNATKTRIAKLENTISDNEVTIKIQKEKIKMLEESQLFAANRTNLLKDPPVQPSCNHYGYSPGTRSCGMHCGPPQPHYHQCSTSQTSPQSPPQHHRVQPQIDHSVILEEIKKGINNVTECVLSLADVIVKADARQNDVPETKVIEQNDETAASQNEILICDNESIASFDGSVPDLPPLNSRSLTTQLQ